MSNLTEWKGLLWGTFHMQGEAIGLMFVLRSRALTHSLMIVFLVCCTSSSLELTQDTLMLAFCVMKSLGKVFPLTWFSSNTQD